METGRKFSISGINSGHHNLPTYEIGIEIGQCWICAVLWRPLWKWWPVEIFQCRESIQNNIIYPHIKFWWYQTMLNFYLPFFMPCFGSHFENGRHLENFENAELLSIIIHLEVININVRNFNFPIGFYSNPHIVNLCSIV